MKQAQHQPSRRDMRRALTAVAAALAAMVSLTLPIAPAMAQQQKIKIGLMLPYTGTYAALGNAITNAFKLYVEPQDAAAELDAVIAEALPEIEAGADDYALHILYFARSQAAHLRSQNDLELVALEHVMFHAQRTEMPHLVAWFVTGGVAARFYGSTPLPEMLAWIDSRLSSGVIGG